MMRKANKFYLSFMSILFFWGVVIAAVLEFHSDPAIDAKAYPREEGVLGETVGQGKSGERVENLFLDSKFLDLQQSVLDDELPEVTYQQKVKVITVTPPSNVRVYDIKTGKLVTIVWDSFKSPPLKVKILRAGASGREPEQIGEVTGEVAGYHDSTVELGKKYFYSVVSVDANGAESKSVGPYPVGPIQNTLIPLPPKEMKVVLEKGETSERFQTRITWKDPQWDVEFINVYRSTKEGVKGERVAQVKKGVEVYIDTDIDTGGKSEVSYYYLLTSVDARGIESLHNLIGPVVGNDNPFAPSF